MTIHSFVLIESFVKSNDNQKSNTQNMKKNSKNNGYYNLGLDRKNTHTRNQKNNITGIS